MVITANSQVVLATNSIYLKSRSQIRSGNVSANGPGSKPFLNSKNELTVGSQVIASESSRLSGQDVRVKSKAKIYGTLNYENLKADRRSLIQMKSPKHQNLEWIRIIRTPSILPH